MAYPYLVNGIVWAMPSVALPLSSSVMLSKHLVESGCEAHEPQAFHDAVEKMTEDEQEDFWETYEASAAAEEAWDAEWELAIKDALEAKHGATVHSFGGFEPT